MFSHSSQSSSENTTKNHWLMAKRHNKTCRPLSNVSNLMKRKYDASLAMPLGNVFIKIINKKLYSTKLFSF